MHYFYAIQKKSLISMLLTVFLLGFMSSVAAQDFAQCQSQLYAATAPKIENSALKRASFPLCFNGFAVMYSGVSRTPLWSAEYLTPQRLKQARGLSRKNDFHEESRIPARYRSYLSDYSRSGYDRGHMAPNGDMANRQQQQDSFSLANMVPQSPKNNQEVWRNLEEATRALVTKQQQSAYVITGPAFLRGELKQVGQVLVPTHVYKVVYFPKLNLASAYFAPNNESGEVDVVSVQELEQTVGINLLPTVSSRIKAKRIMLPLNAAQASKSMQSWAGTKSSSTTRPESDDNQTLDPVDSTGSQGSVAERIKQQLIDFLVNLLRGK